jgi:hypothetical protein
MRYDNFDEGEQKVGSSPELTETGILVPHANHKLREYTLGINYYVDDNQKIQLNLVREDTEDNGGVFWGPQRTVLLAAYQLGFNGANRPEAIRGANDSSSTSLEPSSNAIVIGPIAAPALGFAAGFEVKLPALKLAPALSGRAVFEVLGNAHAPSIFGFPGTTYMAAVDLVSRSIPLKRSSYAAIYGGVGAGIYFQGTPYPGGRLIIGSKLSRTLGLELNTNISGVGRPFVSLEARLPL